MSTEEYITANWLIKTDKVISQNLNIPLLKIISIRHKMGLKKKLNQVLFAKHSLKTNAVCYGLWINGHNCVEISKILKLNDATVGRIIERFLPYFGSNKETITLKSKV